jgi:hypothetical protein
MRLLFGVAFLIACSEAVLACSGCGCRGGPGYRSPDGRCVGWAQLNAKCGNPPTSRCTYEGKSDSATLPPTYKGSVLGSPPTPPLPPAGPTSNVQKTRVSGIGCRDQSSIYKRTTCVSGQTRDCEREKTELVEAGTCAVIPAGTTVKVEASSYSFDWLRIRVPGHPAPLWTDRRLVLER